jgi:cell division protein FtsB
VFNGTGWQQISSSYATVTLDQDILDVIQWARKKRKEEQELKKLSEENVAIKDLLEQVKEKQQQIQMVATLIRKEETV